MGLLSRKKTVLAKIESTYGTDPTPVAANAILVKNFNISPLDSELIGRDLYRSYLGNSQQLIVDSKVSLDFEVELAGSGTRGVAPGWGPLLKACAFAETLNTSSVSITRSGAVATVTLASHGLAVGDSIKISGATESEYNGTFTIATVPTSGTFTYAVSGSPATPATGSPVLGTTVVYEPVSDPASMDSVSIYFNLDGVLHKILGARGSAEFTISAKQIPVIKFNFQGLFSTPTDTAAPAVDYSLFQTPKVANTTNTTAFSLFSFAGNLESMNLNMSNQVEKRTLIGNEEVIISDRKPAGTFLFEAPLMASKNFFDIAEGGDHGTMTILHGIDNGHKVQLDCPNVSIGNPSYQDSQGINMISVPFVAEPTDSGNDEITVTVK